MKMELILILFLLCVSSVQSDFTEPLQPRTSLRSLVASQTRLPCRYKPGEGRVVQVTWYRILADGSKDQIITVHFTDGRRAFDHYSGHVRFESSNPTENSALLIPTTEVSDEGNYTCHVTTFPNGIFERSISLTVWSLPIATLERIILREGESFCVAASCRAVAHPLPRLTWDTDLPGLSQNHTSKDGVVFAHYSLHPLRSMNGKKLDCLVWHPGLDGPHRLPNRLVVHYPPDASISSSTSDWYEGLENAELTCDGGGFPEPQNVTWTWEGGALPDGVTVVGGKLLFGRRLRMNDTGIYECVVENTAGVGKTQYTLAVTGKSKQNLSFADNNMLLIIIGASAAALIVVLVVIVLLVNRHHGHRNKKLEKALSEKTEEINTLSRHASFRRLDSVSTDTRVQLQERSIYKDSQSTLTDKWGPAGAVDVDLDELGRPVIWQDGMESIRETELEGVKKERRKRVESYLKSNSYMSLDSGLPSSLVPLKAQLEDSMGPREPDQDHVRVGDSPQAEVWPAVEGYEDEDSGGGSSNSYQISEALTNHFYYSNGVLRPRPHSNAILLQSQMF